jgi:uncharacterized protein YdeI (YjbR/CyaY-like superfamily)
MKPRFFASPAELRRWMEKNSGSAAELLVGFHKRASGTPSVTWPESVDQALCFGWIDGIRKNVDATRYTIRFTPRREKSIWSAVNTKRARELIELGLMHPAGQAAFEARRENRSGIYAYEQRLVELPEPYAGPMKKSPRAREFFAAQPPSYRKTAIWWVISAKQEPTRLRRLATLIADSEAGRHIKHLARTKPVSKQA